LDIDMKNGRDGEKSLREVEEMFGKLPVTVECKTPTGGRHLYFRYPDQPVKCTESQIGVGLDIKGDGGYVVCAPSLIAHTRRYYWNAAAGREFAAAPDWLLDKVKNSHINAVRATPVGTWRSLVRDGVDDGKRNTSVTKIAGYLMRRSVDPRFALELLLAWDEA